MKNNLLCDALRNSYTVLLLFPGTARVTDFPCQNFYLSPREPSRLNSEFLNGRARRARVGELHGRLEAQAAKCHKYKIKKGNE